MESIKSQKKVVFFTEKTIRAVPKIKIRTKLKHKAMNNKIFMKQYQNAHKLTSEEVLAMFNETDGRLHGIQRDTIGIDEQGNILPGNVYYSATTQCGDKNMHCIVHVDENEEIMPILMSHKIS